jgi:hypothetical protein
MGMATSAAKSAIAIFLIRARDTIDLLLALSDGNCVQADVSKKKRHLEARTRFQKQVAEVAELAGASFSRGLSPQIGFYLTLH